MKNLLLIIAAAFAFTAFSKNNIPLTPFTEYKFDAKQCKFIQHNKSRISVPAYTFYSQGKLYEGEVTLKYREFTDQLDIILNNIPMNYNENYKHHLLESAGMFELYAYGNGKQLTFAPNKKIQVQMATQFNMTGGETFILDKINKVWYKNTSFGNLSEANDIINDSKSELWNDNFWQNSAEDNFMLNDTDGLVKVTTTGQPIQNFEEMRNQTFKTMNVDKMEMYNCDRILNEETTAIIADFNLIGYKEKFTSEIFVVYKNRNAVITYYPAQFASDFKLLPNEDFTIFSFANDGKIAVLDYDFTKTFSVTDNAGKKVIFPMKVYPKSPNTKKELALLTGL
jgi:hypothetical protein